MIITGYQGIGKTTLASKNDKIIDLESSSFWKHDEDAYLNKTGNKTRHDDWYIYYCQVAQDLSRQGYTVFVSCHKEVRKWLSVHNTERFCAIFPDKSIKKDWLKRLKERYEDSKSEKDLRAYEHAEKCYDGDIYQLWYECQYGEEYFHDVRIIKDINYNLEELVNSLQSKSQTTS